MHGWDKALYSKCYYIEKIEILLVFPEKRPFRPQYACACQSICFATILQLKMFRLGNTVNSIDEARQTLNVGIVYDINKEQWSLNASRSYFLLWFREPKIGCFNRKWISTSKTDPIMLFCSCLLRVLKDIPRLLGVYRSNPGVVGFCGLISSLLGLMSPQFEN
uniref:Uncharacterized protein n=1 Tax=Oncorhynchus mykiss TaxID=8022 RepID=A0A8C7R063_ONCMY